MMRLLSVILAGAAAVSALGIQPRGPRGGNRGSWSEVGSCIADGGRDRVFKSMTNLGLQRHVLDNNTPELCQATCFEQGYGYAAVRMSVECWCSADPPNLKAARRGSCERTCGGNDQDNCGGDQAARVFAHSRLAGKGAGQEGVARLPNKWAVSIPCGLDSTVGESLLRDTKVFELESNSPLACTRHCDNLGFKMAAVEYSNECMCGNGYKGTSLPQSLPKSECYMSCPGDNTLTCGAGNRVQIYSKEQRR